MRSKPAPQLSGQSWTCIGDSRAAGSRLLNHNSRVPEERRAVLSIMLLPHSEVLGPSPECKDLGHAVGSITVHLHCGALYQAAAGEGGGDRATIQRM